MKNIFLSIAFVCALGSIVSASAQTYPSRGVTMVVPYSRGGALDAAARPLAESMGKLLGQTVRVDNRDGGGGTIGIEQAVRAAPDGYTVSVGTFTTHVVNGAIYVLQFDLLKDTEPVAMIATNPVLILSKAAIPPKDLKELIVWVRANQNQLIVGSGGVGSESQLGGVYFQNVIGTKLRLSSHTALVAALIELVRGQIDVMFSSSGGVLSFVRTGKIRAYAVAAKTRSTVEPDIPTVDEAGLPGFYMGNWYGIWAPRGTPKEAVDKLNGAVVAALSDPATRQRLEKLGVEISLRDQQSPEALGAHHKAEIDKWWPIIKTARTQVE